MSVESSHWSPEPLAAEARFCGNCGTALTGSADKKAAAVPVASMAEQPAHPPRPAPSPGAVPKPRSKAVRFALEAFLWLCLIGIASSVFFDSYSQTQARAGGAYGNAGSTLFSLVLFAYLVGKVRRSKRPWLFGLGAVGAWIALVVAGGAARGYQQSAVGDEMVAAVERFDPEAGRRLREANKSNNEATTRQIVVALTQRAILIAPDAEVLAFNSAQLSLIRRPTGINLPYCMAAVRGSGYAGTTTVLEQVGLARAAVRLIDSAARQSGAPVVIDEEKVQALHAAINSKIDPGGIVADPAKFGQLSEADQCQMYLRLMDEMHALPPAQGSLMLRHMARETLNSH